MVLAHKATLTAVATALTPWMNAPFNTVRQCLREWYRPAENKCGKKRRSLNPQQSFRALLAWILRLLPDRQVALALDASTLKDRLTILCISVLVGGCAIPVAWRILPGNQPQEWKSHWLALLEQIAPVIKANSSGRNGSDQAPGGQDRFVLVLTDRGLWALWLFQAIERRGWHPLMRVNGGSSLGQGEGYFQIAGQPWRAFSAFAPGPGRQFCSAGRAFKKRSLPCQLLVFHGEHAQEPWYLVTDFAVNEGCWYSLRFWIEHQFKQIKSDGWEWEQSRIKECDRAERLWLAYAVGLLWAQSFGSQAEENDQFDERWITRRSHSGQCCRRVSLFKKGLAIILARLSLGLSLQCPSFMPNIWPSGVTANNTS